MSPSEKCPREWTFHGPTAAAREGTLLHVLLVVLTVASPHASQSMCPHVRGGGGAKLE